MKFSTKLTIHAFFTIAIPGALTIILLSPLAQIDGLGSKVRYLMFVGCAMYAGRDWPRSIAMYRELIELAKLADEKERTGGSNEQP